MRTGGACDEATARTGVVHFQSRIRRHPRRTHLRGPGGLVGQDEAQREAEDGSACRHDEHAAQAYVLLQLRHEEHPDEGADFPDASGMPWPVVRMPREPSTAGQCRGVRPELDEEVAEAENEQERHDRRGQAGIGAER